MCTRGDYGNSSDTPFNVFLQHYFSDHETHPESCWRQTKTPESFNDLKKRRVKERSILSLVFPEILYPIGPYKLLNLLYEIPFYHGLSGSRLWFSSVLDFRKVRVEIQWKGRR